MTTMQERTEIEIPEGHGLLSIADSSGDTRIMWNPRDKGDVDAAKAAFDAAKKNGYLAYTVGADGESSGEVIREFDKKLGKIIMVPQTVGG